MPLPGIPPWYDQDIVLYHGTMEDHVTSVWRAVDPQQGGRLKDFGQGFYTTKSRHQAELWAYALANQIPGGAPAVVRFAVERNSLAGLDVLFFVRGSPAAVDFWSFVQYCRTTGADHNRAQSPWYDVVAGPVTGAWRKQTVIPDADQVSFHTRRAAVVLDASRKERIV